MAVKSSGSKPKASPKKPVSKPKAPSKPRTTAKKPAAKAAPKAAPKDSFVKAKDETKSEKSGGFSSFLNNFRGAFGQLHSSTKPLDFSAEEKKAGLKAAGTMERLGGTDGTWDKNDLANNLAQMQTSRGLRGRIESTVARNSLFDTHNVPEDQRAGIIEQSHQIKQDNPNISRLHKLEQMNPEKITDPAKRAKYDELKNSYTSELKEKGLLPVGIPALQQMGDASDVLKEKLTEAGLPVNEGDPVNVQQYRGLFEGKAPIRTQLRM